MRVGSGKERRVAVRSKLVFEMPRSLLIRVVLIVVVVAAALFALSRIDPTKTPKEIVKVIPDNALAH